MSLICIHITSQYIMKNRPQYTLALLLTALTSVMPVTVALGEDFATHSFYPVTSCSLGPLLIKNSDSMGAETGDIPLLMITGNSADILTSRLQKFVSTDIASGFDPGSRGIAISASFGATGRLELTGAFGMSRNLWSRNSPAHEKEASWEANLGVIYRLVNNLSYELHFGYMETGDLFTEQSGYDDIESIIMVNNRLTLSF